MKIVKLHNTEIDILLGALSANEYFGHEVKRTKRIINKLEEAKQCNIANVVVNEVECEHEYKLEGSRYFEDRFVCQKCGHSYK